MNSLISGDVLCLRHADPRDSSVARPGLEPCTCYHGPPVRPCCGLRHPLPWDHNYKAEAPKPARKYPLRYWTGLDARTCICGHHDRAHGAYGCDGITDEGLDCGCLNERAR